MKPATDAYLTSILAVLENEVRPTVTEPYLGHRLDLTSMILLRLIADQRGRGADTFCGKIAADIGGLDSVRLSQPIANQLAKWKSAGVGASLDLQAERQEMAYAMARGRAEQMIDTEARSDLIRLIAKAEKAQRDETEARIGAVKDSIGGWSSVEETQVTAEQLAPYLARRFDVNAVEISAIHAVPGGRSKATIMVAAVIDGAPRDFVLRKDFSKNFMGGSVTDEFPIIKAAFDNGISVPEPLWLEDDPSAIGGPFIAFARVPGRAAGTMFDLHAPEAVVRDYARQLARLHGIDLSDTGLGAALTFGQSGNPVADMIEESYAKHRVRTPGDLLLEAAHNWMLDNLDCVEAVPRLVHGDCGFHNVLWEADRMTALLDWELAHAGDPAEDLMKCKALAETAIPWTEFMAIYTEAGGLPMTARREKFFTIWRLTNFCLFAADARAMFESGEDGDLRLAAIGYNTFNRLEAQLAEALAAD